MKKITIWAMLLSTLLLFGCENTSTGNLNSSASGGGTELKKGPAQDFQIKTKEGGSVDLSLSQDAKVKIIFPQEALSSDSTLSIAPITESTSEWKIPGFGLVDKNTNQGPAMTYPALLVFQSNKDLGPDVSIVQRGSNGDTVVPSKVTVKDGKTMVTAQVEHFSDYGLRNLTADEKAQRESKKNEASKYNWVIYVNDTHDLTMGPIKAKIKVNFKAVNTSGDILGTYKGTASANTVNDGNIGGGKLNAHSALNADPFEFTVEPFFEPAPLTEREDGLSDLEPAQSPDFMAYGRIRMAGGGVATGTIGGYSGSGATKSDSTDPFTIMVTGPLVRLTVEMQQGTMYLNGYIRGEGK